MAAVKYLYSHIIFLYLQFLFQSQASFAATLASYRQDSLFDYAKHLKHGKGRDVVSRYYNHLKDVVDPLLEKRNQDRLAAGHLTYPYMQPRWVTNSIQT